jgi:hypothetical protein
MALCWGCGNMRSIRVWLLPLTLVAGLAWAAPRALLIDGPSLDGYDWRQHTAAFQAILEAGGLFDVDVVTSPSKGEDFSDFQPRFNRYKVVVLNYGGEGWPLATLAALDKYLQDGGGVVALPAADSAFPQWPEYNLMIGVSAAANREKSAGPLWFYNKGNIEFDPTTPGPAGKNLPPGPPFKITIRNTEHPVTKGLPLEWLHAPDELAGNLRGPGKNMIVLGTAYSDPARGGTGRDEPDILALSYGKGRVFHMLLGHGAKAIESVDFQVLLARGAEWAATGKVKQTVPADFPSEDKVSTRSLSSVPSN